MAAANVEPLHARNTTANFVCQRCSQPLKLHSSFSPLDEQTASELSKPVLVPPALYQSCAASDFHSCRHWVLMFQRTMVQIGWTYLIGYGDNGQEFMMVGLENREISHNVRWCANLFDLLTDTSTVDHPLCEECTDFVLDQMDAQLRAADDDRHQYKKFLEKYTETLTDKDIENISEELKQLQEQELQLIRELEAGEKRSAELNVQISEKKEELKKLEEKDRTLWSKRTEGSYHLTKAKDQLRSMEDQIKFIHNHNEKLEKTNAFNATFHIWHNGHFGTINGFRLGRLDHCPVEWDEINAAWGQAVLLLHSLAKRMGLEFKRYRLVPHGSLSYIEALENKKEYPLTRGRGHDNHVNFVVYLCRFDNAMVAYLDCLEQFKTAVEEKDKNIRLPYKMDKGRIEDPQTRSVHSIKAQLNSLEGWTKALKYMLTNLKWGLAWVSSHYPDNFSH
ncbi:BECN1 [Cordylochernes scorpioides]|uniref:BECN1 n=1 Tax=Cordylochernes scorpioides TaxID=51811 RepID=A0ABY6JWL5_9ARAC|nr:BECN1 [Cordylochernes scorpioides]